MAATLTSPSALRPAAPAVALHAAGRHAEPPAAFLAPRFTPLSARPFLSGAPGGLRENGMAPPPLERRMPPCRMAGFGGFGAARKKEMQEPCPCGGGEEKLQYKECCEPIHKRKKKPESGLELMKSRFSAYAKGQVQWVVLTTHPDHPSAEGSKLNDGTVVSSLEQDVKATVKKVDFLGLEILEHAEPSEEEHLVRFTVRIRMKGQKGGNRGQEELITETSRFVKEGGRWLYIEGAPEAAPEDNAEARAMADAAAAKLGVKAKGE